MVRILKEAVVGIMFAAIGLGTFAVASKAFAAPVPVAAPLLAPATIPVGPILGTAPAYNTPVREWKARRISVDATAGTIRSELGIDVGTCSVTIFPPASQVNIGGNDVDNSTKYFSICTSGCDVVNPVSIDTGTDSLSIRSASGTVTVVILVGSGC